MDLPPRVNRANDLVQSKAGEIEKLGEPAGELSLDHLADREEELEPHAVLHVESLQGDVGQAVHGERFHSLVLLCQRGLLEACWSAQEAHGMGNLSLWGS